MLVHVPCDIWFGCDVPCVHFGLGVKFLILPTKTPFDSSVDVCFNPSRPSSILEGAMHGRSNTGRVESQYAWRSFIHVVSKGLRQKEKEISVAQVSTKGNTIVTFGDRFRQPESSIWHASSSRALEAIPHAAPQQPIPNSHRLRHRLWHRLSSTTGLCS